ncbi:39002_t:CDS:1, partial [Gigaspora margarita]
AVTKDLNESVCITRSKKKTIVGKMHISTTTVNTRGLFLNAHKRLCFCNPSQSLDLYEYKYIFNGCIWVAYACINKNIKLYHVIYDLQNKTVSGIEFEGLLDSKTNISGISYNGYKEIS